jgi:SAM-dependent methyltransferase
VSGNPNFWKKYHQENSTFLFTSQIEQIIKKFEINSILEIGCGIGDNLKKIKGKKVVGVDLSDFAIQKARKKYPKFEFHVGDILEIQLEEKFDLVFTCAVIEHIKPESLDQVFNKMLCLSDKYILNIEAFDKTEHEIDWHRGKNEFWTIHMAKRWKEFPVEILQDINIDPEYRLTLISKKLK